MDGWLSVGVLVEGLKIFSLSEARACEGSARTHAGAWGEGERMGFLQDGYLQAGFLSGWVGMNELHPGSAPFSSWRTSWAAPRCATL